MTLKLAGSPRTRHHAEVAARVLERAGYSVSVATGGPAANGRDPLTTLLAGVRAYRLDLLVASASRLPVPPGEGLILGGVLKRQEPRDVLVNRGGGPGTLADVPPGTTVGVQGARRLSLLLAHRPDLDARRVPGDATALGKALEDGSLQAIILSAEEARELGVVNHAGEALDRKAWLPAPAQGAVALVHRTGDATAAAAAELLGDPTSLATVMAERAVMSALGAQPGSPLGALALPMEDRMRLWAMASSHRGDRVVRGDLTGPAGDPRGLGRTLAKLLLRRGGADVLGPGGGAG